MSKYKLNLHMLVLAGSMMIGMFMQTAAQDAPKGIERVVQELNKNNPAYKAELDQHINTFERLIHSFLSRENTESFQKHFQKMEKAVGDFKRTAEKYSCTSAKKLRLSLDKFLSTMRKHTTGNTNCITLGIDLIAHEHLLPKSVRDGYGPFELPGRLSHRLNCKD